MRGVRYSVRYLEAFLKGIYMNFARFSNFCPLFGGVQFHHPKNETRERQKKTCNFYTRTSLGNMQKRELVASAEKIKNDIIYIENIVSFIITFHSGQQWKFVTSSTRINSVNSLMGGIRLLLSPHAYTALNKV